MNMEAERPLPLKHVRLQFPIDFDGGFASVITVRPLWEVEKSLNPDQEATDIEEMATATGLPAEALLELDPADWCALWTAYGEIMTKAEQSGRAVTRGTPQHAQ